MPVQSRATVGTPVSHPRFPYPAQGPEINFFNHLALAVIAGGTLAGWYFARAKQIGRHRARLL